MVKIKEMGEGIVVDDAPVRTTRDEILAKGKRGASSGNDTSQTRWPLLDLILDGGSPSQSRSLPMVQ